LWCNFKSQFAGILDLLESETQVLLLDTSNIINAIANLKEQTVAEGEVIVRTGKKRLIDKISMTVPHGPWKG